MRVDRVGHERVRRSQGRWEAQRDKQVARAGGIGEAAITQAQNAAARVMQPEPAAALPAQTRRVDRRRGLRDEAFRRAHVDPGGAPASADASFERTGVVDLLLVCKSGNLLVVLFERTAPRLADG